MEVKMNNVNFDECNCSCHLNSEMKHSHHCCEICPNCERRIKSTCITDHKKNCKSQSDYQDPLDSPVVKTQPYDDFI